MLYKNITENRIADMGMTAKKITAFICFIAIFLTFTLSGFMMAKADTTAYIKSGTSLLRVRESAGGEILTDSNGDPIYLNGGTAVTVLDTTNSAWYKITFSYNGQQITGYVSSSYIVYEEGGGSSDTGNLSDGDFESFLTNQGFPDSYKPYLRELHAKHPSWTFYAVQTGIDWNTLVENERNKSGQIKNLVYCTNSNPHYNWRSTEVGYNSSTNTWYSYDGSTWFAASNELVKYYLDPRTYLYEAYIFAFESLSYQEGVQNQTGVESILGGSFMANATAPGEDKTYSAIIMNAAKESNVSPYHLAARMKQEMGNTAGVQATGKSSSYPGIFNYFNIGAFDSPSGAAVTNGLKWAATFGGSYGRPWDTPSKSIIGGAQYLAQSYIAKGQDTLYTQKFNVTNKASLFNHQYMTNVQAPSSEGYSQYRAYANNGLLDSSIAFKIPVYLNMPAYAAAKPSDNGTPNDYLKSLSIDGYSLTPSFSSTVSEYSLIVDGSVSSVVINASAVASSSSVTGGGKVSLAEGTNKFTITVTSDTGSARNYTITIVRNANSSGGSGGGGSSSGGSTASGGGTGSVKRGDLNGDGKITALDIIKVQRLIVGLDSLTDEAKTLGDVNQDGKVTALDIIKIQRHIVGLETIKWE